MVAIIITIIEFKKSKNFFNWLKKTPLVLLFFLGV